MGKRNRLALEGIPSRDSQVRNLIHLLRQEACSLESMIHPASTTPDVHYKTVEDKLFFFNLFQLEITATSWPLYA